MIVFHRHQRSRRPLVAVGTFVASIPVGAQHESLNERLHPSTVTPLVLGRHGTSNSLNLITEGHAASYRPTRPERLGVEIGSRSKIKERNAKRFGVLGGRDLGTAHVPLKISQGMPDGRPDPIRRGVDERI